MSSGPSRLREGFNEAAETAAEYAGDLKDKVANAASGYAATVTDTVSDYADNARRNLSAGSDRVMSQAHTTYQTGCYRRHLPFLVLPRLQQIDFMTAPTARVEVGYRR